MDRITHCDSRLDVLTALAISRHRGSVSPYDWGLCYPLLAIATVKAAVSIYRTVGEKPIERYKAGFKFSEDHRYVASFKSILNDFLVLNDQGKKFGLGSFDLKPNWLA